MSDKVDPLLLDLSEKSAKELRAMEAGRFGIEVAAGAAATAMPDLIVLVKTDGTLDQVEKAGLSIRSVSGDVVTGMIDPRKITKLAELDSVLAIESSRPLAEELDLSLIETRANIVHAGPPGRRGAGTIIGIIDSGIDFTHPAFLKPDGTTRILAIWDQSMTPQASESSPSGFSYGVEYSQADINAAIASPNPFTVVRHKDSPAARFHGTHVAGIAAGDGSVAGQGQPAGTFVGVAPEADIIVVRNIYRGEFATSAETLDAANYIFTKAAGFGRPVVINQSQGDNLGAHDGTSLLEQGLDNLLGGPGRAYVKSAGNAADDRIHAEGTVAAGSVTNLRFSAPVTDVDPDIFDVWYSGSDSFTVRLRDPDGNTTGVVSPGNLATTNMPGGNRVRIDHRNNDPRNGDKRIFIIVEPGTAARVNSGNWTIELNGATVSAGGFHAWIQRGAPGRVAQFLAPHESSRVTISTPGCAAEVISTASYITRGGGVNALSTFSSRGPTRDGRASPTIAAPGQFVIAPRGHYTDPTPDLDPYQSLAGTSMAAPHVAGTIALMLQKNDQLTAQQVRNCLTNTARADAQTGPTPNTAWGAGKLDSKAALDCVPTVAVPVTIVGPGCPPRTVPLTACPPRTLVGPGCPPRTLSGPGCPPRTLLGPGCPPRTLSGPGCPPRTLVGPGCPPRTLSGPGCPPRTLSGPGCPPRTLSGPGCPPRTLVGPGCPPRTLSGPGCPPRTLPPVCAPRTLSGPRCPPRTLPPACAPRTVSGPGCPPLTIAACPGPRTFAGCGPFGRAAPPTPFSQYDEGYWYGDGWSWETFPDGWEYSDDWGYYDNWDYYDEAYAEPYAEGYDQTVDYAYGHANYSAEMTDEHGNMYAFDYDESWFEDPDGYDDTGQ